MRQFAEESGIPCGTLPWWSWRVRHTEVDADSGFVELVEASPRPGGEALVRLDNGLTVEVHAGADASWMRELVVALRSC